MNLLFANLMGKLTFSGHEKFHCRNMWLKKGRDFLSQGKAFNDPAAVVDLGVGKNMVSSIRYWMKAFDLVDADENPTELTEYLFGEGGKDPFLEDQGTLWLLHYFLVKAEVASIYSLTFNEFRRVRNEFNRQHLLSFVNHACAIADTKTNFNEKTVTFDIGVLIKNYIRPVGKIQNIEDSNSGILIDLQLISALERDDTGGVTWYRFEVNERKDLPLEILLFAILDKWDSQQSISFNDLMTADNSPGTVFGLHRDGMFEKIEALTQMFPQQITFKQDAGIQELQFKGRKLRKKELLDEYYGN
jgi:hypothetical protein